MCVCAEEDRRWGREVQLTLNVLEKHAECVARRQAAFGNMHCSAVITYKHHGCIVSGIHSGDVHHVGFWPEGGTGFRAWGSHGSK